MHRNETESIGYPIALHSRDHSVIMRFLLTQLLHLEDLLSSVGEGSSTADHLLRALDRFHQLGLLYAAPSDELEEEVVKFYESIDLMKIELMRFDQEHSPPRLRRAFGQMAKSLRHLFSTYLKDENLLLFLLHNAAPLESIYGQPVVPTLLKRGFGSLAKARGFLEERYQKRGFYHVMPSIAHSMAQLES